MAHKVVVLGMLITLHSLGLLFASLFTYKWYVDSTKEVGVFGICEYINSSSINGVLFNVNGINTALLNNNNTSFKLSLKDDLLLINPSPESSLQQPQAAKLVASDDKISTTTIESTTSLPVTTQKIAKEAHNEYSIVENDKIYQKCYQLLWPEVEEAFDYLATKPVFLTAMMGVSIASASLGVLTLIWSFVCVVLRSVGSNSRASELLILLSILTDIAIISSFGLFMGKDGRLYSIRFYGVSFWLSVGSACGFFLTSILFSVNRINIKFKYMLRNYQNQFVES